MVRVRKATMAATEVVTKDSLDVGYKSPKRKDGRTARSCRGKLSHSSPPGNNNNIISFFARQMHLAENQNPLSDCRDWKSISVKIETEEALTRRSSPRHRKREGGCGSPPPGLNEDPKAIEENKELTVKTEDSELVVLDPDSVPNFIEEVLVEGCVISPTPHKIQMAPPQTPSTALSQLHIGGAAKKAVKARRRLNPSQTANQQPAGPKRSYVTKKELAETNHKVTEYFPIRRSGRKTKRTVLEEKQLSLERAVKEDCEEGLQVCNFEGKGRGVVATRHFCKGDFVVEYCGELINMGEAKSREQLYTQDQNTGCYMYYFKYKNDQYCIDATKETGRLGRLVNHSRNGNLTTKTISIGSRPHLVLLAKESISAGEEVLYDYGDRSKESLVNHPWLNL